MKILEWVIAALLLGSMAANGIVTNTTSTNIGGKPEVIYDIELDMNNPRIQVDNGFSFGLLYGFETTSAMVAREGAYIGVNGMFYDTFGMPMGSMTHDGIPIRTQNIGTPVFLIGGNNEMDLEEYTTTITIELNDRTIEVQGINQMVSDGRYGLFNHYYGSTTRVRRMSVNYMILDGEVVEIITTDSPVKLEGYDYVITYVGEDQILNIGDDIAIDFDDNYDQFEVEESFQTGGWLIKDGEIVAKNYENFLGYTTAPQPRTLIGYKQDGTLIITIVDGRQKGVSLGLSGKESAWLMLDKGCYEAAYLDGGASSTYIKEGKLMNMPSGGEERTVAHSILISYD